MDELYLKELPPALDRCVAYWHTDPADFRPEGLVLNPVALELAFRNYLLWHEEDKARRTDVDDSVISLVKRNIDRYNQERNDLIEKLDEAILRWIEERLPASVAEEINSETPGSIVDRISILTLKIYHMREDSLRSDIAAEHRERSEQRLAILTVQRSDLFSALGKLFADYLAGTKKMKLYRQYKMYNDPSLNPELYRKKRD